MAAEPGADPVREPGPGVGLVDDDGDLPAPGGKVHRGADVAADADQDVRPGLVQDDAGLFTAPASWPGSRSRSSEGLRGKGTG